MVSSRGRYVALKLRLMASNSSLEFFSRCCYPSFNLKFFAQKERLRDQFKRHCKDKNCYDSLLWLSLFRRKVQVDKVQLLQRKIPASIYRNERF